jgi:hypothetical protein
MWNELCGCIDENWKALKARIQASITGIKLNGTTYYQTDGTGICDLGDIQTEIPKASEIELDDGRDVQTAIVAIDDAMPDKVNDVEPMAVTDGINLNETDGNGTTARMLIRADDSLKFDGLQVGISDKTDGRITKALNTATTAGNKADDAQNTADTAITNAKTAQDTADSAQSTANTASSTASTAYQTAVTAKTTAETADGVADEAKTTADSALTKAKNAIVSFVTSVTDKVLNATVTKGDDTTETVPLFTAGNNLSWNGKTLNAVGGAAYTAGDGITLADGAFSVNYGSGLQLNASTNAIEVDSSAMLANTMIVEITMQQFLSSNTVTVNGITYKPIEYHISKFGDYDSSALNISFTVVNGDPAFRSSTYAANGSYYNRELMNEVRDYGFIYQCIKGTSNLTVNYIRAISISSTTNTDTSFTMSSGVIYAIIKL